MHPHDEAIAGYLYVLSQVDSQLTRLAIQQILQTSGLWRARRLAEHIQKTSKTNPIQPPACYAVTQIRQDVISPDSKDVVLVPFRTPAPVDAAQSMSNAKNAGTITRKEVVAQ